MEATKLEKAIAVALIIAANVGVFALVVASILICVVLSPATVITETIFIVCTLGAFCLCAYAAYDQVKDELESKY